MSDVVEVIDVGAVPTLVWGDDGPPVVMLHGAGLCAGVFEPIASALAAEARCIAPDLRGHGRRSTPERPEDHALTLQARDLIAVLDGLEVERAAGLGHSYGGAVLLQAALDFPDRFGPLLLHEPAMGNPIDPPEEAAARGRRYQELVGRRRSSWPSTDAMLDELRDWQPYGELGEDFFDALARWGTRSTDDGVALACAPETEGLLFVLTLSSLGGNGLIPRLGELVGRADPIALSVGTLHRERLRLFEEYGRRLGVEPIRLRGAHFALFSSVATTLELVRTHLGIGSGA
jgi:pimeloyl-ACP methyl ester carboxylesterase